MTCLERQVIDQRVNLGSRGGRLGQPRKIDINENAFRVPDLSALYWLGFLLADGSVSHKPRWVITVRLARRDLSHLEMLQRFLGGRISHSRKSYPVLMVYSKILVLRLAELGVVPRKTYNPVLPRDELVCAALLREIFDGDGCLHINKGGRLQAAFCGHPLFVNWFIDKCGVKHNGLRRRGQTLYVQWTSSRRAHEVVRRLYIDDGAPALDRKLGIVKAVQ